MQLQNLTRERSTIGTLFTTDKDPRKSQGKATPNRHDYTPKPQSVELIKLLYRIENKGEAIQPVELKHPNLLLRPRILHDGERGVKQNPPLPRCLSFAESSKATLQPYLTWLKLIKLCGKMRTGTVVLPMLNGIRELVAARADIAQSLLLLLLLSPYL